MGKSLTIDSYSGVVRMPPNVAIRSWMPALGASIAAVIIYIIVLSIPLAAGRSMGLSSNEFASWIVALYGIPGAISIVLSYRLQQPVPLTGTLLAMILVASIGTRLEYPEIIGAFMLAGVLVTIIGIFGLTVHLARWIPAPIVWALLAGVTLPFIVDIFAPLGDNTIVIGSILVVYFGARYFLGSHPMTIAPALVTGLVVSGYSGDLGSIPLDDALPTLELTMPSFSIRALASVAPVVVILMTLQANVPTAIQLRSQGYDPPERRIDVMTGLGTTAGSFLGPVAISMSLPLASLSAGRDAGEFHQRHRVIYLANGACVVIALLAGSAAALAEAIPLSLLLALAGLALLGVFISAIQQMVNGKLILGPIFTFAVAFSDLTLFGFGSFFWALVIGIAISVLLERAALSELRAAPAPG
jgi:benzoate membrane transport protein